MIIVQEISTSWTKQSRSARAASARNAIPDTLPLPWIPAVDSSSALIHHIVRFHEASNFRHPHHELAVHPIIAGKIGYFGCVRITVHNSLVQVQYAYDMFCGGAPERYGLPRQVIALAVHEWGRIQYNGRWSSATGMGAWTYKQTTVNIAYQKDLTQQLFANAPKTTFRDLADLR